MTCIDSRIDPLAVFGLVPGDAKILRNAGPASPTTCCARWPSPPPPLGVTRIAVVQHTDCKMTSATDDELRGGRGGQRPGRPASTFEPLAISDQPAVLRGRRRPVLASPLVPDGVVVGGLLLDLHSGRLTTVVAPRTR